MTRHTTADDGRTERVRIPADVDRDDQLLAGLTARQLAILAVAGLLLYAVWAATRHVIPLPVFSALACPAAGAAVVLAVGRWHGLPADKLARTVFTFHRSPRRLIPAPAGVGVQNATAAGDDQILGLPAGVGALDLPVRGISVDGTLDLGPEGSAVLCTATAVSFALRSPAERHALVAAYGRYLNSLSIPIQVLIAAEPIDLQPAIRNLQQAASRLPHPGLQAACRDHAGWLTEFAAGRPLLHRDVLLVLRNATPAAPTTRQASPTSSTPNDPRPSGTSAAPALRRAAADAAAALTQAGVTLTLLDGRAAADRIARFTDPARPVLPGRALPNETITGPSGASL